MRAQDFCYWLQGYFELSSMWGSVLTSEQVECIKKHLNLVFVHDIDPSYGDKNEQDKLNAIHETGKTKTPGHVPDFQLGGLKARC